VEKLSHNRRLNKILNEIDYQPEWRGEADRCHQYFDGKQLDPQLIQALKERRQPVLTSNLIAPAINGVLGMEARSRTGWFIRADDNEFEETAEALNVRVAEALRMAKADKACSDAYLGQIVGGIGWVEVKKNKDPLGAKYRIGNIHRDEIDWDWKADNWLLRKRWIDVEEAVAAFPKYKDIIEGAAGEWSNFDTSAFTTKGDVLSNAYDEYQYSTRDETEWLNPTREMIKIYELYYRVWESEIVMRTEDGRALVYNAENNIHVAMVASGKVEVERRSVPKLRLSWFAGPHHLVDMPSPHPHNHYPYIPFFGSREDKIRIPYGLVRPMLSPQDEINFRRIKLTAQLNYKRIVMDEDATKMSDEAVIDEVHASDGMIKLNPQAKRNGGARFTVETDQGIAQQQFQIMQEAKTLIQDVAGIYNSFLGKEGGAQSGVAINSLVEQGATTLADINDNYREARQMVGELVMAHEVEELKDKRNVRVVVPGKKLGEKEREIFINQEGEAGELTNAISHAKTQVVLGEIQQSPGYRAQVTQMLMDFLSKLPQELQLGSMDIIIEQIDLPQDIKERLMKAYEKLSGNVNPDDLSEEEAAAMQAEQEKQQQKQEAVEQIEMKSMQLQLQELQEKINKLATDSGLTTAKTGTEQVKAAQMAQEMKRNAASPPPLPEM
jgi:hypothetical protein